MVIKPITWTVALLVSIPTEHGALAARGSTSAAEQSGGMVGKRPAPPQSSTDGQSSEESCGMDFRHLLWEGEIVREVRCAFDRQYIFTNKSLLVVEHFPESGERKEDVSVSLSSTCTRTDMKGMIAKGIVDWEPTEDAVLVLTRADSRLYVLPNEDYGETIPAYQLHSDVSRVTRDRMVYHSKILFIAASQSIIYAMSFQEGYKTVLLSLRSSEDAGFFMRKGILLFGKAGVEETEIRVEGGIDNIRLKRIR